MVIEDLVLCQEEAVEASGVHEHLFYGLSFQDVLVDLVDLGVPLIRHVIEPRLPDQMGALGQDPDMAILHLGKFEL
jgi:hypothetical protein